MNRILTYFYFHDVLKFLIDENLEIFSVFFRYCLPIYDFSIKFLFELSMRNGERKKLEEGRKLFDLQKLKGITTLCGMYSYFKPSQQYYIFGNGEPNFNKLELGFNNKTISYGKNAIRQTRFS